MARRLAVLGYGGSLDKLDVEYDEQDNYMVIKHAALAVHLHHHEQAARTAQREALQRGGRGKPDREGGEGRRGGYQLGSGVP